MVEDQGVPEIPVEPEKSAERIPEDIPEKQESGKPKLSDVSTPEGDIIFHDDARRIEWRPKLKPEPPPEPPKPKPPGVWPDGPIKYDTENLTSRGNPKQYVETADGRRIYKPVIHKRLTGNGKKVQTALTRKRKKLIRAYVKDPDSTLTELAEKSGMSVSGVSLALNDPSVTQRIEWMMESRPGLKRDKLLDKLEEGLEAKKAIVVGRSSDSKVLNRPDFAVRHQYLETAFKLNGDLRKSDDDNGGAGGRIQLAIIVNQERVRRGLDPVGPGEELPSAKPLDAAGADAGGTEGQTKTEGQ